VAGKKPKGPEGPDEDLTQGVDAAPTPEPASPESFVDKIKELVEPGDQGEATEAEADVPSTDGEVDVPSGEELADEDLGSPEPFEIVDADAEELTEPAAAGDDTSAPEVSAYAENRIDQAQLGEAEEEAAAMPSARPVKKQRLEEEPAATAESSDGEPPDTSLDVSDGSSQTGAQTPVKKNRPTRTRAAATASVAPKTTTPGQFIGQVVQELKKVSWPTGAQLARYFVIVLGFVLFMILFIGLLDVFFGWLMLKLFG